MVISTSGLFLNSYLVNADIISDAQRHLKVGRGRQKYDFLYDGGIHFRSRTRIGTMHMFIGQFFKENSNFDILEVLELISRTQVDLENNILMDYDRELFVLKHYM